jgi:hypothetical protein
MPFTVPATWSKFSTSGDGQSETYTRPGHTVKEPRLAIISRTIATFDAARGTWSVPGYRVRVFDGVLNSDGQPDPTRTLVDATFRSSLNSDGASRGDEVVSDFLLIVDQADFVGAAFGSQEFPAVSSL